VAACHPVDPGRWTSAKSAAGRAAGLPIGKPETAEIGGRSMRSLLTTWGSRGGLGARATGRGVHGVAGASWRAACAARPDGAFGARRCEALGESCVPELVAARFATFTAAAEGCDALLATGLMLAEARDLAEKFGIHSIFLYLLAFIPSDCRQGISLRRPGRARHPRRTSSWPSRSCAHGRRVLLARGWAELGIDVARDGPTPTFDSLSAALTTALTAEIRAPPESHDLSGGRRRGTWRLG